ncbi:hypothetical protein I2F17_02210 [Acinetobacter sp. B10A]|nr:hypothetical protein [Acinetobacter baretiae]
MIGFMAWVITPLMPFFMSCGLMVLFKVLNKTVVNDQKRVKCIKSAI